MQNISAEKIQENFEFQQYIKYKNCNLFKLRFLQRTFYRQKIGPNNKLSEFYDFCKILKQKFIHAHQPDNSMKSWLKRLCVWVVCIREACVDYTLASMSVVGDNNNQPVITHHPSSI